MAYKVCFPVNGKLVCVDIPLLMKRVWPWEILESEFETNWIFSEQLEEQVVSDITVLAAMARLAEGLSVDQRHTMNRMVDKAMAQIKMPEGFTVQRQ